MEKNEKIAVLCIDMQNEFFKEGRPMKIANENTIITNVSNILNFARKKNYFIIYIRHLSNNPSDTGFSIGSPYTQIIDELYPKEGEIIITKSRPGAFYMTELDDLLKKHQIEKIILCGALSHLCCDTTAREAHARGYKVFFVKDAIATLPLANYPAELVHGVICEIQALMFSKVMLTQDLITT